MCTDYYQIYTCGCPGVVNTQGLTGHGSGRCESALRSGRRCPIGDRRIEDYHTGEPCGKHRYEQEVEKAKARGEYPHLLHHHRCGRSGKSIQRERASSDRAVVAAANALMQIKHEAKGYEERARRSPAPKRELEPATTQRAYWDPAREAFRPSFNPATRRGSTSSHRSASPFPRFVEPQPGPPRERERRREREHGGLSRETREPRPVFPSLRGDEDIVAPNFRSWGDLYVDVSGEQEHADERVLARARERAQERDRARQRERARERDRGRYDDRYGGRRDRRYDESRTPSPRRRKWEC